MAILSRNRGRCALICTSMLFLVSLAAARQLQADKETTAAAAAPTPTKLAYGDSEEGHKTKLAYGDSEEGHKTKIDSICLIKTSGLISGGIFTDTFRLCEPADEPDVCLKRRYYDEDRYEESRSYEPSLTDSLLDSDTAAVCRSVAIGGCPSYLVPSVYPPAGCLKFQTNCTFTVKAAERDWPSEIEAIQAESYGLFVLAEACPVHASNPGLERNGVSKAPMPPSAAKDVAVLPGNNSTDPIAIGVYRINGGITLAQTRYGLKEAKGTLEVFDQYFIPARAPIGNSSDPYPSAEPELRLVTPGQMNIKLLDKDYDYSSDSL